MPVPKTRDGLTKAVTTTYEKLRAELDEAGPAERTCDMDG